MNDISKETGGGTLEHGACAMIPLVIAADDKYAETMAVCLYSILENTRSKLDIFVLDGGISAANKKKLEASLGCFQGWRISYTDMGSYGLSRFPSVLYYGITAFARYFIPEICTGYDKVVFTDPDVVFTQDIKKYYDIDLEGYGLAATPDEMGAEPDGKSNHILRKKRFGIPQEHRIFSNGNLLISCDYWRKNNITEKLIQKTIELYDVLIYPDLDVMNIVFASNYKILGYEYCCCVHFEERTCCNAEMERAYRNPFIIHYAGPDKPWKTRNVAFYGNYKRILDKTHFRDGAGKPGFIEALGEKIGHFKYLVHKTLRGLTTMHMRLTQDGGAHTPAAKVVFANATKHSFWNDEPGGGYSITCPAEHGVVQLKADRSACLHLAFGAAPLQDAEGFFPLHITYKHIYINGEDILQKPVHTTAEKPFRHDIEVQEGDTVEIRMVQRLHMFGYSGIKKLLIRRYPHPHHIDERKHTGLLAAGVYVMLRVKRLYQSLLKRG